VRIVLLALGLLAAGLIVVGCGSDDSGQTIEPISIPSVTAPTVSTSVQPTTTTAKPGTTTSQSGKTYNPNAPDSPTNDVPPPAGSPQEAFEKQCQQNPSACG
jgi:hypothetical protein